MAERTDWIEQREALLAERSRVTVRSATAIAREAGAAVEPGDDRSTEPEADDDTVVRRRGRVGAAIGSAVHGVLELIDVADPGDLDAVVKRQCAAHAIPDMVGTVAAMVRSALASDAVQLAATRPHHKEVYVAAPLGDGLVEGYVDLLIEGDDGLIVVDYKTDTVDTEAQVAEKLAGYELQGAAYAAALEQATGLEVTDVRFVFCRPSGPIERSVAGLGASLGAVAGRVSKQVPL